MYDVRSKYCPHCGNENIFLKDSTESHTIRSYYPYFLIQKVDGTYIIVEVEGDNKIEDPIVRAKQDFAEQMAEAAVMTYRIIKWTDAAAGRYSFLLSNEPQPYQIEASTS